MQLTTILSIQIFAAAFISLHHVEMNESSSSSSNGSSSNSSSSRNGSSRNGSDSYGGSSHNNQTDGLVTLSHDQRVFVSTTVEELEQIVEDPLWSFPDMSANDADLVSCFAATVIDDITCMGTEGLAVQFLLRPFEIVREKMTLFDKLSDRSL